MKRKEFFDGEFEEAGDFERKENRRRVVPAFESDDGLSRHSDCSGELFLGHAPLLSPRLHSIHNVLSHSHVKLTLLYQIRLCPVNRVCEKNYFEAAHRVQSFDFCLQRVYTEYVEVKKRVPQGARFSIQQGRYLIKTNKKDKNVQPYMETVETPQVTETGCESCKAHAAEKEQSEESAFALLLALMPVMVLTFFGQVGLL